jgi:hypothetical protein
MADIPACGVDPGLVNMAAWVGTYNPETFLVTTALLCKNEIIAEKKSVQAGAAAAAMSVADACLQNKVEAVCVETAPQWNVPIRLAAAAIFGVFVGRGLAGVRYSCPSTKSKAVLSLAEHMGMVPDLEQAPKDVNKLDKKVSAKIRLINKRNAVKVARQLLTASKDEVGLKAFDSDPKKQDDMADALLLGCGVAMSLHAERLKASKPKRKKRKIADTTAQNAVI